MTVTRIAGSSWAVCGTRTPGDSSGTPGGRDRSGPLVRLAAGVRDSGPTPVVARSLDAHARTPAPAGPGRRPAGGAAGPPGGEMLDWGFGCGRSARTGLRLPGYVAPAGVTTLLVRPPR